MTFCLRRSNLISCKAIPMFTLLLTPILLCSPAHAGHWQFSAAGSTDTSTVDVEGALQTQTPAPPPWTPPPAPSDNSLTLQLPGSSATDTNLSQPPNCDCNATATLTITANWVTDTTSDNTPPTSIWLCENSSSSWAAGPGYGVRKVIPTQPGQPTPPPAPATPVIYNGSASNASSDPYVPSPATGIPASGSSTLSATQTAPPDGWHKYPVSGTQIVLPTRTVTAEANVTGGTVGKVTVTCSLAYSITVHAQPYNMVLSSYKDPSGNPHPAVDVDNVNGILTFHYSISSTDGVPADLASISAYETLNWSGNPGSYPPGQYIPPSPPVQMYSNPTQLYAYNNPDKEITNHLVDGYAMDRFSPPTTGFVGPLPFPSTVWKVTQNYLFDDSQTGEIGVKIPGPDNKSPFTITRTVTPTNLAGTTGTYSITTRGAIASESL